MDFPLWQIVVLVVLGTIAGVINALAGGGSNLTVPALMIFGLPPDVANATNRVSVFLQGLATASSFKHHDKLPTGDFKHIVIPLFLGAAIGAVCASWAPQELLKYLLLGAMILVALISLVKPSLILAPDGTPPFLMADKPSAKYALLLVGFYGGFVQAGVGFLLISVFAGVLRYDIVSSNALKALSALCFTALSLVIFISRGQVYWFPGLCLGCGAIIGSLIGVRIALKASKKSLKWFIFMMTLVAGGAAIYM